MVEMISSMSIPCRWMLVVPRLAWPSWRWMTFKRDTLAGELDGVRMTQLVGSEPSPDTCLSGTAAKLAADGGRRPRSTAGRAVNHAEQRARRELEAL